MTLLRAYLKGKFFARRRRESLKDSDVARDRQDGSCGPCRRWRESLGCHAAAKAGGHALTKNGDRAAPYNIRVNAIAQGVTRRPCSTRLTPEQVAAVDAAFNAMHPLGRNGQRRSGGKRFCSSHRSGELHHRRRVRLTAASWPGR